MKRPYLHETPRYQLRPMTVYAVADWGDIKTHLGDKKEIRYTTLKTGVMLAYYTK